MYGQLHNVKEVVSDTLIELEQATGKIVVLDADLGAATGSQGFQKAYPWKHIQAGIAEQNLVALAAGVAAQGFIPFAASFSCFATQRACDQLVNAVGYNQFNVNIIGAYGGLTSEKNGGTHIGLQDVSIARNIPGFAVLCPGDGLEVKAALKAAAAHQGPVYIQLPRGPMPCYHQGDITLTLGQGEVLAQGQDIALITTGITTWEAILATKILNEQGIHPYHLHLPSIKPLDKEGIITAAKACGQVITVENHSVYGGLGSAVTEVLSEFAPTPVKRLGIQDAFGVTATLDWLMHTYGIDSQSIVQAVKTTIHP